MPVRYDPLIVHALAREIRKRWGDSQLRALRMDRGRRAVELSFADGSGLLALLHPLAGHILASPAPIALGGTEHRFGRLFLSGVEAPPDERALLLVFSDASGRMREGLALELQTQRWNALRLQAIEAPGGGSEPASPGAAKSREGGGGEAVMRTPRWRIEAALLSREAGERSLRRGQPYAFPSSSRAGLAQPPSAREWLASLSTLEPEARRKAALQTWSWLSTLNIDWVLGGSAAEQGLAREQGLREQELEEAYERYLTLRGVLEDPSPAIRLLPRRWGPQPYPHPLGTEGETRDSLLGALAASAEADGGIETLLAAPAAPDSDTAQSETQQLAKKLRARLKRLRRRGASLQRQLDGAGPPDEPRALGQLLLAHKQSVRRGAASVTLEDFDGATREIELDPKLNAVGNAQRLFDEARRRERALERLPPEIETVQGRHDEIEAGLGQLEQSGPSEALWTLAGGRPAQKRRGKAASTRAAEVRLPYTRLVSSGGLEIRVGRGPKDNDDLTFRESAPDDIWLHASQASGAHVILRWGRRDENPPRRDLLEAAIAAAVNSGARHSGTVAVVWTRRKYVRSPRKAPPGTVVPGRVQTVFVKPDEKLLARLRPPS